MLYDLRAENVFYLFEESLKNEEEYMAAKYMANKVWNIYYLALNRESLPTPNLDDSQRIMYLLG